MRILATLPLDERPSGWLASGLWAETLRAAVRQHHFLPWATQQTAWGIPDLLVRMPDRAGCGEPTPIESRQLCSSQGASEQVRELGTGMPDEVAYVGHLVTFEEARQLLQGAERSMLTAACNEWLRSVEIDEQVRAAAVEQGLQPNSNNHGGGT